MRISDWSSDVCSSDLRGRRRADEDNADARAGLGESGVLGQKAVAGMDRLRARRLGRLEDRVDAQIALRGRGRPDAVGGIGIGNMGGGPVGLRVEGDAAQTEAARDRTSTRLNSSHK